MRDLIRHFRLTTSPFTSGIAAKLGAVSLGVAAAVLNPVPSRAEEPQVKIVFVGDSMSDGVGAAVQRFVSRDACLSKRILVSRHAEIGTGLARADRFKWPE